MSLASVKVNFRRSYLKSEWKHFSRKNCFRENFRWLKFSCVQNFQHIIKNYVTVFCPYLFYRSPIVIPMKTNFPRFKSGVQHFPGEGPGGWSNFFKVVGGSRVQLAIPIETLSFFLHYVLTPLGTSDGYSGIPSSEGVS